MSTIPAACPHCDAKLKVQDSAAGKKIRCPKCKEAFTVPAEDDEPAAVAPKATALKAKRISEEVDEEEDGPRGKRRPKEVDDDEDCPRRKKRKKPQGNPALLWGLIGGGAGLVLIGAVVAIIIVANSGKGSSSRAGQGSGETIEIRAPDLVRECANVDEDAFKKKYQGTTLIVTGVVFGVDLSGPGKPNVQLRGTEGQKTTNVTCVFENNANNLQALRAVKPDSTARIKGKFGLGTKLSGEVIVTDCEIISSQDPSSSAGSPSSSSGIPTQIKATELARDLELLDEKAFLSKYKNTTLVIEGQVRNVDTKFENAGYVSVVLLGDADQYGKRVEFLFKGGNWETAKKLQKGSYVRIKGKVSDTSSKDDKVVYVDAIQIQE